MILRKAVDSDLKKLLDVQRQAFGDAEGPEIVELVSGLLTDPTAAPLLSLVAEEGDRIIGHILFTKVNIALNGHVPASLLAPLAVAPELQNRGVGGKLIVEGLKLLAASGVKLVFVLGHPEYYPRHGFKTAGELGFEAPYPIPPQVAGAWMVHELTPGIVGCVSGKILCADVLDRPEYWRE